MTQIQIIRSQLSAARITAMTLTMAMHLLALMVFMVPTSQRHEALPKDILVTEVVFVPREGVAFVAIAPVAPPQPEAPQKEASSHAPAPVTQQTFTTASPERDQGDEPMESRMLTMVTSENEMAALDLPAPEHPPTEILSYRQAHQPVYPVEAKLAGESGWVKLRVLIDAEGLPHTFIVMDSTATDQLIEAAINAVKKWRFNPATSQGKQVAAWIEVPIGFWNSRTSSSAR